MPQGERIGIHDNDPYAATTAEGPKVGAVVFQSMALFHQNSKRGRSQKPKAQAFKQGLVLGLGKHLERRAGMLAHDARHQRDQKPLAAHFRGYGQAFEHVSGESGSCHYNSRRILHDIIRFKRFHSEPVGLEEPLYLITEERRAQWHLHYVLSNLVCIHPAASFPILPVPPAMELTNAKLLNKNRFPKK